MPVAPGYAEITIHYAQEDDPDPYALVFGVDPAVTTDPALIAESAFWAFTDAFKAVMNTTYRFIGATARVGQDGTDDTVGEYTRLVIENGLSNGPPLPQNCAALIKKVTGFTGRANRGRMYLAGVLLDGDVDGNGVIVPTTVAALQDAAEDFRGALFAPTNPAYVSMQMVILHSDPLGTEPTPNPTLVTGLSVDHTIATQRRRLRR